MEGIIPLLRTQLLLKYVLLVICIPFSVEDFILDEKRQSGTQPLT